MESNNRMMRSPTPGAQQEGKPVPNRTDEVVTFVAGASVLFCACLLLKKGFQHLTERQVFRE